MNEYHTVDRYMIAFSEKYDWKEEIESKGATTEPIKKEDLKIEDQ